MHALLSRFAVFGLCVALSLFAPLIALGSPAPTGWWLLSIVMWGLTGLGIWDIFQTHHAVLRNYPIIGHLRYLFEESRPALRQYFIEDDQAETPFSRADRSLVYQRAKQEIDKRPFGTQLDVYSDRYEWINHSMTPSKIADSDFRITVGGPDCTKPLSLSVLNISAMSFGALSANAILALNQGARAGNFAHDTGEGGISRYHKEHGGDLIWNIGSGYFGCRDEAGRFSEARFIENATRDQVKMIEVKLSQGAKPGHGGILPGGKVTAEIAAARGVQVGQDCNSPATHSEFDSPVSLLQFIARLRRLSGGKPVGFKLCIGHPWEWFAIAKAMVKTGITPDFIVIDGAEGGTGAAPIEFVDHVGTPLREAIRLVHNTLVGLNLRDRVKLGASGKIVSAFDMMRVFALGADWCNSARAFMFAIGCIQAQQCHTGRCPTGVATQDPDRQRALVPEDKAVRVAQFHHNTLHALAELLQAAGLEQPAGVTTSHIAQRKVDDRVALMSETYRNIAPGSLLNDELTGRIFETCWPMATPDSFKPLLSLPESLTRV